MSNPIPHSIDLYQGETRKIYCDWGENTAAEKTGRLMAGDTVSSCVVAQGTKPGGAADLTFGSVTVPSNTSSDDIRGRVWSVGEATICSVTAASNQTVGSYTVKLTATTANGETLVQPVKIYVRAA